MHTHTIAAGLSDPASNWMEKWKSGWDSTPSVHSTASGNMSTLILLAVIALVIFVLLRRAASA